jgi:hypothetical protein
MSLGDLLARIELQPVRRLKWILGGAVGAILLGLITHGHYAGSGDAVHYMMIARSLAFDRDLDLLNDYADPNNLILGGRLEAGQHVQPGRGGITRPVHDVGLPFLAAPYFGAAYLAAERLTPLLPEGLRRRAKLDPWIALRQLVSAGMILVTCLLAIVFFDLSLRLTGQKALAFLWTLVFALSPPILSHGYVFFTEVPTALVAVLIYRALDGAPSWRPARAVGVGLLVGLLPLLHVRNVGLAVALAAVAAWRLRSAARPALFFGLGAAVGLAVKLGLNLYLWGQLVSTPHAHLGEWPGIVATVEETATRLFGLLLDPSHGLLLWAPVYLLAPAGLLWLGRRVPGAARELLILAGAYLILVLLPMTNIRGWDGGWSPAARYLVPIVPLLALGVPALLAERRARWIAGGLCGVQLLLDGVFWSRPMLLWSEGDGPTPMIAALFGDAVAATIPRVTGFNLGLCLAALGLLVGGTALTVWLTARR